MTIARIVADCGLFHRCPRGGAGAVQEKDRASDAMWRAILPLTAAASCQMLSVGVFSHLMVFFRRPQRG
ncbi:hypothetical protein BL250_15850 [Erwinia sp. OLTSP20]|uniref:hypothetical protein n=1 Tax=Erwinia sp. OLSSP12 TaxID=1912096 RepID=UPI000C19086E|nr:hypothetical protein [Erwinia sp. OLSSP12]PIJ52091.1 hypothetical protein BV501_01535 [Erwinia sp. OAMSP11]PIJ84460.1 hypothetical protein BLD47_02345 [Erwinia sp. OLCASP19]PIJ87074.1 hypothetical protein BLD46_01930 [Erwinia sp. OLMTSP26]PIJ88638.1 hypothetical protein BLD49_01515 [Erwinia sp. OLMDSP33]PIJ89332.1 hypothetical protein BL250_15850 [Erwinia sp. OLTSP20]PIJ90739.1 hypothetical protein BL249_11900 [Erwinia sp. OLFS4]